MSEAEKITSAKEALLQAAQTLFVTITGETGRPEIGTSPFYRNEDGAIYIYTSQLAAHVRALLAGHKARFLIIADEQDSQNIWARLRLNFEADYEVIPRESAAFSEMIPVLEAHFGATMSLIKQFSDFHLVKITPTNGVCVTGFAAAYHITGPDFEIGPKLERS